MNRTRKPEFLNLDRVRKSSKEQVSFNWWESKVFQLPGRMPEMREAEGGRVRLPWLKEVNIHVQPTSTDGQNLWALTSSRSRSNGKYFFIFLGPLFPFSSFSTFGRTEEKDQRRRKGRATAGHHLRTWPSRPMIHRGGPVFRLSGTLGPLMRPCWRNGRQRRQGNSNTPVRNTQPKTNNYYCN